MSPSGLKDENGKVVERIPDKDEYYAVAKKLKEFSDKVKSRKEIKGSGKSGKMAVLSQGGVVSLFYDTIDDQRQYHIRLSPLGYKFFKDNGIDPLIQSYKEIKE